MSSAARDYFEGYRIQNDISREMSAWKKHLYFLFKLCIMAFGFSPVSPLYIGKRKDYEKAF